MAGKNALLFSILMLISSLAGCLGESGEFDTSDLDLQITNLEQQLDEKNQTLTDMELQISSYEATVDGLEDAISDATENIARLQQGLDEAEEYRDSLLAMLHESNNSVTDLHGMIENANYTIQSLQVSIAENQSLLSQSSSIIANLISGWDSTNSSLNFYLAGWGSTNATLDYYLSEWDSTNSTIDSYIEGWDSANSTISDLLQQIAELNSSSLDCNSTTTVSLNGECVSRNSIWGMIPFVNETNVSIGQSFMGGFTHQDDSMYSVDFFMTEGTPVVAYKAGKIKAIKEDSNTNCIDEGIEIEDCNHANYVVIDHGDFTFSYYLHLQQYSVDVQVGESVGAGHQIGRIGNTGYSTEAHLHLEISNGFALGDSIMILFEELRNLSGGVPFAGLNVISQNTNTSLTTSMNYSNCPLDLFYFRGVELSSDIPCSVAELDQSYFLTGKVLIEDHTLLVGLYESSSESWNYTVIQTNSTGHFSTTITWSSNNHSDYSYLMLSIRGQSETYGGWWTSIEMIVK